MADKFEEKELSDKTKSNQHLTGMQKLLFGMVCWGVQSWSQAGYFKANGYDYKYIDARKAMHTGIAIYGLGSHCLFCYYYFYENTRYNKTQLHLKMNFTRNVIVKGLITPSSFTNSTWYVF